MINQPVVEIGFRNIYTFCHVIWKLDNAEFYSFKLRQ